MASIVTVDVAWAITLVGLAAGLRAMMPAAVLAWSAHLGYLEVGRSHFEFVSSPVAVAVSSLFAVGELIGDLLPFAPDRTAPIGLGARVVFGSLAAACLLASTHQSLGWSPLAAVGSLVGAYLGIRARTGLVRSLKVKDLIIALPEDVVAVGLALCAVVLVR